ncbi:MAG TPA: DUF2752 domain-containing protein [Bacteroidales bacterium]|nr:DUF2752 domain-containing protein [Bacteroidales bacterium]
MIVPRAENKTIIWQNSCLREPYIIINFSLGLVILLVMAYSLIFSPDKDSYPVVCIHEKITGEPCVSCGLSHSFSLILRGRINEAFEWNRYGMRVFLFFSSQLLLRIVFSFFYISYPLTRKQLIIYDATGSSVIFLLTFMPFLIWIFRFS